MGISGEGLWSSLSRQFLEQLLPKLDHHREISNMAAFYALLKITQQDFYSISLNFTQNECTQLNYCISGRGGPSGLRVIDKPSEKLLYLYLSFFLYLLYGFALHCLNSQVITTFSNRLVRLRLHFLRRSKM